MLTHFISAMLQDRASCSSFAAHALEEIATLREHVSSNCELTKLRIDGATEERKVVAKVCVCVCVCV